jgi:hypothetical protein
MAPSSLHVAVALALLGAASAVCPNMCSGHGTCGADELCSCFQDWGMADEQFGDCSEQYCPSEIAFVDSPNQYGQFHGYMECSGKGICDRSSGECECFDGYTGKGCQRHTCPNDCSGHGTCEYIEEMTYGTTPGIYWGAYGAASDSPGNVGYDGIYKTPKAFTRTSSKMWDHHKSMACHCDAGWIDVDCSRRMCPKANDVMDERLNIDDTMLYQQQNITLYSAGLTGNGTGSLISDFYGKTFALTFVSTLNETYSTVPIDIVDNDVATLAKHIRLALLGLPNKVITDVNVVAKLGYEDRIGDFLSYLAYLNIMVEFTGSSVMGPQNLLIVEADLCDNGCTPKITGLSLASITPPNGQLSLVNQLQKADYNNYECGRRGKCDYDSGLCECFEGYTGEACSIQTALV